MKKRYRRIKLTQGKFALVDVDMFDILSQYKWCAYLNPHTGTYYAVRGRKRSAGTGAGTIRMSRSIVQVRRGWLVDHKNHNTLDNRRSNLRVCTNSQNLANRRGPQCNSRSKILGVCFDTSRNKWMAHLVVSRVSMYLGRFLNKRAATCAYRDAKRKYFGEFGT